MLDNQIVSKGLRIIKLQELKKYQKIQLKKKIFLNLNKDLRIVLLKNLY